MNKTAASVPGETGDARLDQDSFGAAIHEFPPGPAENQPRGAATPVWAPDDACTLPTAARPVREAEFEQLFATALRELRRPAPTWLRLNLAAGDRVEAATRDLIARESSCCSFFISNSLRQEISWCSMCECRGRT